MKLLALILIPIAAVAEHHVLKALPETVVVGHYDTATKPALRIQSGDTVEIEALGVPTPELWEQHGLDPAEVEPALRAVVAAHPGPHPGPHLLTGPIYVEGAQPGDVLQVNIVDVKMATPYAFNGMYQYGALADQFPIGTAKVIRLDLERGQALFAPKVRVPLRPFFGSKQALRRFHILGYGMTRG
jgi:acetamidase/formamidase